MADDQATAAPAIDWQNDPDFHQLPLNEKHQVLMSIDSDYKALPPQEQSKALNAIHYQGGGTEGTGQQFTGEREKENQPGFIRSSLNTVGRQLGGFAKESVAPYTKGYDMYQKARESGMGVGASLAAGAGRGALAAFPTGDPLEQGTRAANIPPEFKQRRQTYGTGYAAAAPLGAEISGVDLSEMEHQADIGNTRGVMAEAAVPAAELAAGEGLRIGAEKTAPMRNARRMAKGTEKVTAALDTPPGKGGERAARMDKALNDTRADLADLERERPAAGKGADAFKDLNEKIEDRRQAMWDEGHKPAVERHKDAPINMQRVLAEGKRAITPEAAEAAPGEAKAANEFLDGLNKERTVQSTDKLIREINDDLRGENAATRYGKLQIRTRQAVIKALRGELDTTLENLGEKGIKDVNRRWGALGEVQDQVRERAVQEYRKEAKAGPIPDWVHLYSFMHPSGVIPAVGAGIRLSSLFKPNAGRQLNKGLKLLGSTDLQAPYQAPTPPGWNTPPAGLLPAPRTELPPPGTAELQHPELFPRPNPGVPAARQVYRDVGTGRMQRGFTSQGQPQPVGHTAEGGAMYPAPEPAPQRAERPTEQRGVPRQYAGTERRSLRDVTGPDPMRMALQQNLQKILNDPTSTAHDKAIARVQLDDMKAHPFDEPAAGRDFLKEGRAKTEKRMTKKEATKAGEKRKEGRTKRFAKDVIKGESGELDISKLLNLKEVKRDSPEEDAFIKHYEDTGEALHPNNRATFEGKPFWSGSVDLKDGEIAEVHPYEEAARQDFHHNFYFDETEKMRQAQGDASFFFVTPEGTIRNGVNEKLPSDIENRVKEQIKLKGKTAKPKPAGRRL